MAKRMTRPSECLYTKMLWKLPPPSGRIRPTSRTPPGSGRSGDVEDDGADFRVGSALSELDRLNVVVAVADLELLAVHGSALVQFLILDPPRVDDLGVVRVFDADHVKALLLAHPTSGVVDPAGSPPNVDIGPRQLLLHVDVGDREIRPQRHVREHVHVGAPSHAGCGRVGVGDALRRRIWGMEHHHHSCPYPAEGDCPIQSFDHRNLLRIQRTSGFAHNMPRAARGSQGRPNGPRDGVLPAHRRTGLRRGHKTETTVVVPPGPLNVR